MKNFSIFIATTLANIKDITVKVRRRPITVRAKKNYHGFQCVHPIAEGLPPPSEFEHNNGMEAVHYGTDVGCWPPELVVGQAKMEVNKLVHSAGNILIQVNKFDKHCTSHRSAKKKKCWTFQVTVADKSANVVAQNIKNFLLLRVFCCLKIKT